MNNDWSSLSMRERAEYIKDAVSRGLHTVDSIRNEYKDGGKKKRTALDIQAANKQVFLKSLELSLKGNSRYSSAGWRKYLTDLALLESGYLAGITNSIGAKGYFLLMPSNRASSWSSPTLLFEEMFKMTDSNIQYLKKNMTKADLAKALALGIDIYGLVAGAHLGGARGALNALRGVRNSKDMNGTSVMKYMKLFSQSTPKLTEADYQSNYSTSDLNRNRIVMQPHVEPVDNTYVAPIEPRYSVNPTLLPQGEAEGIQTSLMSLIMLELESPKMLLVEEPEVGSSPLTYILKVSRSSVPVIKIQTPNKVTTASDLYKKYYDVSSPTLLLLNLEEAIYRSNNNEFGNGGLKGNLYGGDNPNGQLMMTVGSIGYMPKIYAEKPDAIHVQKPDLPIFVEPDVSNAAALERQRRVYSNYDEALDNPLNPVQKVIYNGLRYLKDNVYEGIPSGVSNCTLTATQWVNPASPIKLASSIVNDPGKYNYSKISKEDALPGNLVIAKVPNLDSYHTMMLSGFADKDSTYTFDGKKYKVTKGEPLVTYSRGGHDNSFIRRNVPLSVYTSNSDGHTENLFYRYNSPNEVFLPDIVVTAKKGNKRALGGNLFDGTTEDSQQI